MMASRKSVKRPQLNADPLPVSKKPNTKSNVNRKNSVSSITSNSAINGIDYISKMPNKILVYIFQYLPIAQWPSLESVNHKFQKATHTTWESVHRLDLNEDFILNGKTLKNSPCTVWNSALEKFIRLAPNVSSLSGFLGSVSCLRGVNFFQAYSIEGAAIDLLAKFSNLECLDFTGAKIDHIDLARFLKSTTSRCTLKELILGNSLEEPCTELEYNEMCSAFDNPNLPPIQLKKLTFYPDWNSDYAPGFLTKMDTSNLEDLCVNITGVTPGILISLINRCTKLRSLQFHMSAGVFWMPGRKYACDIEKELFRAIASSPSESLFVLKLGKLLGEYCKMKCYKLSIALVGFIEQLGRRKNPILEFSLDVDTRGINDIVIAIAENLHNLTALDLAVPYCPQAPVDLLLSKLVHLEKLRLRNLDCSFISDSMMASMKQMKNLKYLDLGILPVPYPMGLLGVLNSLDRLKGLCLYGGDYSSNFTTALGNELKSSSLEELTIHRSYKFMDKIVTHFVTNSPHLRRLDLDGFHVGNMVLFGVAKSCPELRELRLPLKTDRWNAGYELEYSSEGMIVTPHPPFTSDGIQAVIDGCPHLKKIKGYALGSAATRGYPYGFRVSKYRKITFEC